MDAAAERHRFDIRPSDIEPVGTSYRPCTELRGSEVALAHSLDHDGFTVVRGFLEAEELLEARRLVERALQAPCEQACRRPHNELFPLRWNSPLVQLLLGSDRRVRSLADISDADDPR